MNTETPPLDPLLIPNSPTNQNEKHRLLEIKNARVGSRKRKLRGPRTEARHTLEEAYCYRQGSHGTPERSMDIEKAVRAAAYLLDWAGDGGNDEVNGSLALGVSEVLQRCAEAIKRDRDYRAFVPNQTKTEE
jgi:hypothetical protein